MTVGELIEALCELPRDLVVHVIETDDDAPEGCIAYPVLSAEVATHPVNKQRMIVDLSH